MLLSTQILPKINETLYRPWLWTRAAVLRQRIVVTLAPNRVDLALFQAASLVARFDEACETTSLPGVKTAMEQVLKRIPVEWRAVPCRLVVCSNWVQWSDVPWLGAGLKPRERLALASKRLTALYGDSDGRIVATEPARFGHGQLIAGLPGGWVKNLQEIFEKAHHRLVSIETAHTVAWNALVSSAKQNLQRQQNPVRDTLLATLERDTLTLSWVRRNGLSEDVIRGIRSIQCETDDGAVLRQIQRECVLQRLVNPSVYVVLREPSGILDVTPENWQVFQVSDWGDVKSANAKSLDYVRLDFIKEGKASTQPRWHHWLLAFAIATTCAVGAAYAQWSDQLSKAQDALQQYADDQDANKKSAALPVPGLSNEQREQRAKWQQVQNGLLRPWESLFQCIESSTSGDITLMQIQPDAQTGELQLTGDARTFKAIGKFVQALEDDALKCSDIGSPYLSSYQINEQDPQHTLHFEIRAKWLIAHNSNVKANP